MKRQSLVCVILSALAAVVFAAGEPIRIADFSQGKLVTMWDGLVGEWYDNADSRTVASIAATDALGKPEGRSLKMVFDTTGYPRYSGVFMKLGAMGTDGEWPALDATGTKAISLWVKGPYHFGIEVKSTDPAGGQHVAKAGVVGSNRWSRVVIRYGVMKGRINTAAIEEIVFVFSDLISGDRGVVLVDEIALERQAP